MVLVDNPSAAAPSQLDSPLAPLFIVCLGLHAFLLAAVMHALWRLRRARCLIPAQSSVSFHIILVASVLSVILTANDLVAASIASLYPCIMVRLIPSLLYPVWWWLVVSAVVRCTPRSVLDVLEIDGQALRTLSSYSVDEHGFAMASLETGRCTAIAPAPAPAILPLPDHRKVSPFHHLFHPRLDTPQVFYVAFMLLSWQVIVTTAVEQILSSPAVPAAQFGATAFLDCPFPIYYIMPALATILFLMVYALPSIRRHLLLRNHQRRHYTSTLPQDDLQCPWRMMRLVAGCVLAVLGMVALILPYLSSSPAQVAALLWLPPSARTGLAWSPIHHIVFSFPVARTVWYRYQQRARDLAPTPDDASVMSLRDAAHLASPHPASPPVPITPAMAVSWSLSHEFDDFCPDDKAAEPFLTWVKTHAPGQLVIAQFYIRCRRFRLQFLRRRSLSGDYVTVLDELRDIYRQFFPTASASRDAGLILHLRETTIHRIHDAFESGRLRTDILEPAEREVQLDARRLFERWWESTHDNQSISSSSGLFGLLERKRTRSNSASSFVRPANLQWLDEDGPNRMSVSNAGARTTLERARSLDLPEKFARFPFPSIETRVSSSPRPPAPRRRFSTDDAREGIAASRPRSSSDLGLPSSWAQSRDEQPSSADPRLRAGASAGGWQGPGAQLLSLSLGRISGSSSRDSFL